MSGVEMESGILSSNGAFTTLSNFRVTDSKLQVRRWKNPARIYPSHVAYNPSHQRLAGSSSESLLYAQDGEVSDNKELTVGQHRNE